jgi:hypothetical protein
MGAGIHTFGAGLVAWGVFQARHRAEHGRRDLGRAFVTAVSVHGVWNGTIAVTEVVYAGRSEISSALSDDAAAWGISLLVLLAIIGTVVLGALLVAARDVRRDRAPLGRDVLEGFARPPGIAAWALISTVLLIPATILVLVYPTTIAL